MPTSDEDLQALQDDVQGLREQLADERAKAEAAARDLNNDVAAVQLQAEKARLEAELYAAREITSRQTGDAATSGPLGAAQEAMQVAQAQQAAAEELAAADAEAAKAAATEKEV